MPMFVPTPGMPIGEAKTLFRKLQRTKLADAVKPIEELFRSALKLADELNAKISEAEQMHQQAEDFCRQCNVERCRLLLQRLAARGLLFCHGGCGVFGHAVRVVERRFYYDDNCRPGPYIHNICNRCYLEMQKQSTRYHFFDLKLDESGYLISVNGSWKPIPEDTHDTTQDGAIFYIPIEMERRYRIPAELFLDICPPETVVDKWFTRVKVRK